MTITFKTILYSGDSPTPSDPVLMPGYTSGSLVSDGLYLANDVNPSGSSTLLSSGSLISNVLSNGCIYNSSGSYFYNNSSGSYFVNYGFPSVGLDLGTARYVTRLTLFDNGSAGPGITMSGSNNSLVLYVSDDNSTWTESNRYYPLHRYNYSGSLTVIDLGCNTEHRYLKLNMDSGPLRSGRGDIVYISGLMAWTSQDDYYTSGSVSTKSIVVNPYNTVTPKTRVYKDKSIKYKSFS